MSGSVSIFKKMLCNFGGFHSLFYKKGDSFHTFNVFAILKLICDMTTKIILVNI